MIEPQEVLSFLVNVSAFIIFGLVIFIAYHLFHALDIKYGIWPKIKHWLNLH